MWAPPAPAVYYIAAGFLGLASLRSRRRLYGFPILLSLDNLFASRPPLDAIPDGFNSAAMALLGLTIGAWIASLARFVAPRATARGGTCALGHF